MSLFNKLQRVLGLTYHDEDMDSLEGTIPALAIGNSNEVSLYNSLETENHVSSDNGGFKPQPVKDNYGNDETLPDIEFIFKGVVEFINRQLPPYLQQGINEEAQRKFLCDNLDTSVKEYLASVVENERKKVVISLDKERDRLQRSYEENKERLKSAEEQLSREAEKVLSAERQKRALSLRVNDLESKIAGLQAELEQFDLENRSLLNKLRAAEVRASWASPEEAEKRTDEFNAMASENETLKKNIEEVTAAFEQQLTELKNQITRKDEEFAQRLKDKEAELAIKVKEGEEKLAQRLKEKETEFSARIKEKENEIEALNRKTVEISLKKADEPLKSSGHEAPGYSFISFDDEMPAEPEPVKPKKQERPQLKTRPEVTIQQKSTRNKAKKDDAAKAVADMLDDTDWLLDADAFENPDRVVPPGDNNAGPEQLSLW